MPSDFLIQSANVMQICVPILSMSGYIPQWIDLYKTKSSANISVQSWIIWLVAMFFSVFYAIIQYQLNGRGWPLIISAGGSFLFVSISLAMILYYRHPRMVSTISEFHDSRT